MLPMKRIGVLGGSFNPIHMGHVALGIGSLGAFGLDALIVVPSGNHPFKGATSVTALQRYEMAQLAFSDNSLVYVSDMEVREEGVSYSIDTLHRLSLMYPGDQLVFIQGADIPNELHKWHRADELHKYCSFAIAARRGYATQELEERIACLTETLHLNMEYADMDLPQVSSTEIRRRLACGESCDGLVPENVLQYILERGLYR